MAWCICGHEDVDHIDVDTGDDVVGFGPVCQVVGCGCEEYNDGSDETPMELD